MFPVSCTPVQARVNLSCKDASRPQSIDVAAWVGVPTNLKGDDEENAVAVDRLKKLSPCEGRLDAVLLIDAVNNLGKSVGQC